MKRLLFVFLCAAVLFCGCAKRGEENLLAFFESDGAHLCRFEKEGVAFLAKVEVKENGSALLVSFQKPDTLAGIAVTKTATECTAVIGDKSFENAETLLAPFGIFWAKEATLLAAELKDGVKTISVRCEHSDYTLRYNERGMLVSVEGGGYTLFFEEADA